VVFDHRSGGMPAFLTLSYTSRQVNLPRIRNQVNLTSTVDQLGVGKAGMPPLLAFLVHIIITENIRQ
jgi:hypothetical protein